MVATTLKKLPDEGSPGSFNYLTKKFKVNLRQQTTVTDRIKRSFGTIIIRPANILLQLNTVLQYILLDT